MRYSSGIALSHSALIALPSQTCAELPSVLANVKAQCNGAMQSVDRILQYPTYGVPRNDT